MMKKNLIYTMAAGLLLCAGLASCEMKDELSGGSSSSDTGYLTLGVSVNASQNDVIARADNVVDNGETASVSAADFPVIIKGVTDAAYEKTIAHYSELENQSIELPVGEYTVTSHSDLELKTEMSVPYYEGTTEKNLSITKDVTSTASVVCKMKNTKIQLNYLSDFTANFTSWTITLDDGTKNVLKFSSEDEDAANPKPVYWLVSENTSTIAIHVEATNQKGGSVSENRTLTKPEGGNTAYWTGGDALTIEMNGVTSDPENPNGVSGIVINVNVTFSETEEPVDVPVTSEPTTPGTGGGGDEPGSEPEPSAPEISLPQSTYTLPSDASKEENANVVISAAAGLKSVNVKIDPDTDMFEAALSGISAQANFLTGVEMVGNTTVSSIISNMAPGVTAPSAGDTSYTFPVGSFFNILSSLGKTAGDGHAFIITVTDNNDKSASATLYVKNVTE